MTALDNFNLAALDAEDLEVLSAHLQGAQLKVGDMAFLARDKRFAFVTSRVPAAWAISAAPERGEACRERRLTGVHFERVLAVASRGIDREAPQTTLEIVALHFTPTTEPAGFVTLLLTGNRDIRLTVECLEAACRDLGPQAAGSGGKAA